MRVDLMLFIVGTLLIVAGYAEQMKPSCTEGVQIKYVPREVFDEYNQEKPYLE
uniref:Uncharacterized protein n=1 Tax=viral metagenome TaxID=1070528 RepID=A0A6C0L1I5_9ZZZZ|tara:strand:+ start:7873 stop:8031 length:159 start_codon:yes stop_codon:yes gene_type:complete